MIRLSRNVLPLAVTLLLSTPLAAGTIRGRLRSDERPAAGATVSAVPFEEPLDAARREARRGTAPQPVASATAGADGAFTLVLPSALPSAAQKGSGLVVLRVGGDGLVPVELPGVWDVSESDDLGDVALPRSAPLAGKVVGPGGKPVAGARVTLVPALGGPGSRFSDLLAVPEEAASGADGTFRIPAAADRNALRVEAAGLATAELKVVRSGALARPVSLAPGVVLAGKVVAKDGKAPAAGTLVRWEGRDVTSRWVEAGADGAFRLADLPRGAGAVVADAGEAGSAVLQRAADAAGALRVVLGPPAGLDVRSLDVRSGRAVPRVKLTLRLGDAQRVARTGPDGRATLRGLLPGTYRVQADEPRYVPWHRDAALARGETRPLDVLLTLGATIAGRVVDEEGRPVGGAKGHLDAEKGNALGAFFRALREGTKVAFLTRADGTFRAARLAPGDGQRLTVTHADFERKTLGGVSLPAGGVKANVVVTLQRGALLSGVVKDEGEKPVAGADVTLMQNRTFFGRGGRGGAMQMGITGAGAEPPRARSGADGRFELRGLSPGDYTLQVRAAGYATERVDPVKVSGKGAPEPVTVVLAPGVAISGTVVKRAGGPAEGWMVLARPSAGSGGAGPGPGTDPTGPDGFFLLDGLKAGQSYDLQLIGSAPGLGPVRKGVVAPAEGVELTVTGTGRIEGVALDAKSGEPLPSFTVSYEPDRGMGGMVRVMRVGGRTFGTGQKQLVESPDGRFVLDDVPAGTWRVVVDAKGYQEAKVGGVVVEEGTTLDGVEVRASLGTTLKGRVVDATSGRAVPEATVSVSAVTGGRGIALPPGLDGGGDADHTTDADGRFEVEGLAPGKAEVRVSHSDYSDATRTVDVKEGGATAEIQLTRGGTVGGAVVSDSRRPVAGADVSLVAAGEGGPGRMLVAGGQASVTDESGRFRFEHLGPGRYTVTARLGTASSDPAEAVLTGGETKDDLLLTLSAGATVHGTVTGLPGDQLGGVSINASGPDGFFTSGRTGADGSFEIAGLPVGSTTLRATAGDFTSGTRTASATVAIADGQVDAQAEIRFDPGATLTGRVSRGGSPVSGALVFASARSGGGVVTIGGGSASGRSDDSGAYRIEGLAKGSYSVTVQPGTDGRPQTQEVAVDGDATLDFDLPLARLEGRVVESGSGQPLSDATVSATKSGGGTTAGPRGFGGGTTDSDGHFALEDLDPGSYQLQVRRAGYEPETRSVTAAESGGDVVTVELKRGDGLALQVTDGVYGVPLRGVTVRVRDGSGATVAGSFVTLDSDGRGEVPSIKPGVYTVVLDTGGYAARRLDGISVPGPTLPVSLTPGGSVEIHVGPETQAKAQAATLLDASGLPAVVSAFGADGRVPLTGAVRTLDHLAPGNYSLTVEGGASKTFSVTEGGKTVVQLP